MNNKPKSFHINAHIADDLVALEKYDEAINEYRKATKIQHDETKAYAYHNIYYYLMKLGRYKEAEEIMKKTYDTFKKIIMAKKEELHDIEQTERDDKFNEKLDDYLQKFQYYLMYVESKEELKESYKELRKIISGNGFIWDINYVNIVMYFVKFYRERSDRRAYDEYKKAEDILKKHLENKRDAITFSLLGELYTIMGEFEAAEKNLLCAIKEYKNDRKQQNAKKRYEETDVLTKLGLVYVHNEDFKSAINYLSHALERDSYDINIRNYLATTYFYAGHLNRAEVEFKKIVRIAPEHIKSRIGLAETYISMGDINDDTYMFDEALRQLKKVIELNGLGIDSISIGDKELAYVHYLTGYARVQNYNISESKWNEDLLKTAVVDFENSYNKNPENYPAKRAMIKLKESLGNLKYKGLFVKHAPNFVIIMSIIVFILTNGYFIYNCIVNRGPDLIGKVKIHYYGILIFGTIALIIAGASLDQILKIKVPGVELEKTVTRPIITDIKLEKVSFHPHF